MKYRERVIGLILVFPLCRAPSGSEWIYNKVLPRTLSTAAFFFGKKIEIIHNLIISNFLYVGHVKFAILLWHVWFT